MSNCKVCADTGFAQDEHGREPCKCQTSQPGSQPKTSQPKPKRFCVQLSDGRWVKRTAHFGHFHGSVILTSDPEERRWWTRERDAISAAGILNGRIRTRTWSGSPEIEWKKLGLKAEAKGE